MKNHRFRFVGVFLGVICIIGLFIIVIFRQRASAKPPVMDRLRIGNVREYSIFNVLAEEKGIFRKNGLDATIREYESGPAAVKDLLDGQLDVAFASDNAGVQAIFTNPDLRILAQFVKNRVFSVVARTNSGVAVPQDLRKKKVGVTKQTAGEYLLSEFLPYTGLTPEDLILVDLPPTQIKTGLEQGELDAGILFEPNVFDLRSKLGANITVWQIDNTYYTFGLIYVTQDFARTHPQELVRFLRSLVDAENYYRSHAEETKELIGRRYGYSRAYLDYSWPKNDHSIGLSQELVLSMENIAAWAVKNKLTPKREVPNFLDFIDFVPISTVKPDAVSIIH